MMEFKACCKCKEVKSIDNFGKHSTKKDGFQTACKQCKLIYYYEKHEQRKAQMREYRNKNTEKLKQYAQTNNYKFNAKNAKRKSRKLQATPPWLTKLDLDHIAMFYEAAADQKQYGLDCHVDHIIPLQGKEVCGLHVPWNLQVLPASENISKGNRL